MITCNITGSSHFGRVNLKAVMGNAERKDDQLQAIFTSVDSLMKFISMTQLTGDSNDEPVLVTPYYLFF